LGNYTHLSKIPGILQKVYFDLKLVTFLKHSIMDKEIEQLTKRFTFIWYEKKQNLFVNPAKGYQPDTKTRIIKIAGYNTINDEITGETYSEIAWEDYEEITLSEFCWFDEERFNNHQEFYPEDKLDPFDAFSVVNEICEIIEDLLPDNEVQISFNIINSASIIFREKINSIIAQVDNDNGFKQVCTFIAEAGELKIRKRFERIVQQYIYGNKNGIQLNFELNKQQLAALLFLIEEAGMFTKKDRGIMKKYEFFESFFCWKDLSHNTTNQLTGLKKYFSEFKSGVRTKSVDEVFQMLKKANTNYVRSNW